MDMHTLFLNDRGIGRGAFSHSPPNLLSPLVDIIQRIGRGGRGAERPRNNGNDLLCLALFLPHACMRVCRMAFWERDGAVTAVVAYLFVGTIPLERHRLNLVSKGVRQRHRLTVRHNFGTRRPHTRRACIEPTQGRGRDVAIYAGYSQHTETYREDGGKTNTQKPLSFPPSMPDVFVCRVGERRGQATREDVHDASLGEAPSPSPPTARSAGVLASPIRRSLPRSFTAFLFSPFAQRRTDAGA